MKITRDLCVSTLLVVFCAGGFAATYYIRQPLYASISARLWPRFTLVLLLAVVLVYFVQALTQARNMTATPKITSIRHQLWHQHGNTLLTFALFFLFLLLLPVLGMLLDGIAFVFILQTVLGGLGARPVRRHVLVAIITVGAMWALFTYWLGVIMPAGMISILQ